MTAAEIILLIIGVACFAAGFFLPDKSKTLAGLEEKKEEKRIHELIEKEIEKYKASLYESLEEDVKDYLDKAERGLERISNEKIMAVNEYGDTVLSDINKNHDEAVFLYSMLNEKHDDILKSNAEIENISKEVKKTLKELENVREETLADIEKRKNESFAEINQPEEPQNISETPQDVSSKTNQNKPKEAKKQVRKTVKRKPEAVDVSLYGNNHNEEILRLYKSGKSNVAIAKELGLGVGEVKLVIDLANM